MLIQILNEKKEPILDASVLICIWELPTSWTLSITDVVWRTSNKWIIYWGPDPKWEISIRVRKAWYLPFESKVKVARRKDIIIELKEDYIPLEK